MMSGASLQLIAGATPKTYSIGYALSGKMFRDQRFSPLLDYKEATWLLRNEQILNERDRREGLVTG
jgi:hypothetical protein